MPAPRRTGMAPPMRSIRASTRRSPRRAQSPAGDYDDGLLGISTPHHQVNSPPSHGDVASHSRNDALSDRIGFRPGRPRW